MTARRRLPAPLAATLTVAALLTACGGSPATNGPGGTSASPEATRAAAASSASGGGAATMVPGGPASVDEPCTLLTEAEIRLVTGFEITRIFPNEDVPGHLPVGCNWSLGTPEAGADIIIGVRSPGGAALFDPADGDPVEGIGDRAIQTEPAVVETVKGDTYVSVTYIGYEDRPDITRELARLIMEKV